MCYDVQAQTETQLKRAERSGDKDAVREIREKLLPQTSLPLFHTQGFQHPKLLVYTEDNPLFPKVSQWGLVPFWAKEKKDIWNKTLNARGETLFDKPSFRTAAKNSRCIIPVDGFYEHHHQSKQAYPYYIYRKDGKPITLAGLCSNWTDKETGEILNTFTIVTTKGNKMLSVIHNNPKMNGPRMPVILSEKNIPYWLEHYEEELVQDAVENLIQPFADGTLQAHTVAPLRGKLAVGNIPEVVQEVDYPGVRPRYEADEYLPNK